MNSKTTSTMLIIIAAIAAVTIVLLPMPAEAHIPTVGVIPKCIKSCLSSLQSLGPSYCSDLCKAEFPPPRHQHQHQHRHRHRRSQPHFDVAC
ncbi:hypothetical protein SDJN03_01225, partial [Cucurbita argyrosperma subsp. sororia]